MDELFKPKNFNENLNFKMSNMKMNITAIHVAVICGAKYVAPSGGYAYANIIAQITNIRNECLLYFFLSQKKL